MLQFAVIAALIIVLYFRTRNLENLAKTNSIVYMNIRKDLWWSVLIIAGIGFMLGTFI